MNYRLSPSAVNEIYRELRKDYVSRVVKPNIEESLKAVTAQYAAEELITKRSTVKAIFDDMRARTRDMAYERPVMTPRRACSA